MFSQLICNVNIKIIRRSLRPTLNVDRLKYSYNTVLMIVFTLTLTDSLVCFKNVIKERGSLSLFNSHKCTNCNLLGFTIFLVTRQV